MKRYDLVFMEEMNDGVVSTGMGTNDVSASITVNTDSSSGAMSEDDALSFLSGYGQNEAQEQNTQEDVQNTSTVDNGINIDDLDMSMFGLEDAVNQDAQQQVQPQQADSNTLLMQQMMERIESLQNPQQQQTVADDDIAPLRELAERMQQAGLLPKGLNEEHEALLQEVKSLRDEIKQQKEQQQQVQEFQSKISGIDAFSKELEQVIPNYNTEFMINLVGQITNKDPRAGQQILNNPSMLISLWAKYGAKSQPKQQQSNVLSTNGNGNIINTSQELFEKVKSGRGTEEDELRLLSGL